MCKTNECQNFVVDLNFMEGFSIENYKENALFAISMYFIFVYLYFSLILMRKISVTFLYDKTTLKRIMDFKFGFLKSHCVGH